MSGPLRPPDGTGRTEADLVPKEAYGGHKRRLIQVLADLVGGGETRWAIKAKAGQRPTS